MNKLIAQMEQILINRIASLNASLAHAERVGDLVRHGEILVEIREAEEAIEKLKAPQ